MINTNPDIVPRRDSNEVPARHHQPPQIFLRVNGQAHVDLGAHDERILTLQLLKLQRKSPGT